jgi:hypothetical protein
MNDQVFAMQIVQTVKNRMKDNFQDFGWDVPCTESGLRYPESFAHWLKPKARMRSLKGKRIEQSTDKVSSMMGAGL